MKRPQNPHKKSSIYIPPVSSVIKTYLKTVLQMKCIKKSSKKVGQDSKPQPGSLSLAQVSAQTQVYPNLELISWFLRKTVKQLGANAREL